MTSKPHSIPSASTLEAQKRLTEEVYRLLVDEKRKRKGLEEQLEAQERMLKAYVERFGLILPTDEPRAEVLFPAKERP